MIAPSRLTQAAYLAGCVMYLFCPIAAVAADDDTWHVGGEIFVWGAGIGGETPLSDIDVSFEDIFESLDMTFMGTLAFSRNKWMFAAEIIYLDVGETQTLATTPVEISAHVAVDNLIATLGAGYRLVDSDAATLHGVFGARYLDMDLGVDLAITGLPDVQRSGSDSFWDGVIGLRGEYRFTDDWVLTYYGDVGAGDSESTWHAVAAINYRFERSALVLGYAHLEWDFDDMLVKDLNVSGPYAGFQFLFR